MGARKKLRKAASASVTALIDQHRALNAASIDGSRPGAMITAAPPVATRPPIQSVGPHPDQGKPAPEGWETLAGPPVEDPATGELSQFQLPDDTLVDVYGNIIGKRTFAPDTDLPGTPGEQRDEYQHLADMIIAATGPGEVVSPLTADWLDKSIRRVPREHMPILAKAISPNDPMSGLDRIQKALSLSSYDGLDPAYKEMGVSASRAQAIRQNEMLEADPGTLGDEALQHAKTEPFMSKDDLPTMDEDAAAVGRIGAEEQAEHGPSRLIISEDEARKQLGLPGFVHVGPAFQKTVETRAWDRPAKRVQQFISDYNTTLGKMTEALAKQRAEVDAVKATWLPQFEAALADTSLDDAARANVQARRDALMQADQRLAAQERIVNRSAEQYTLGLPEHRRVVQAREYELPLTKKPVRVYGAPAPKNPGEMSKSQRFLEHIKTIGGYSGPSPGLRDADATDDIFDMMESPVMRGDSASAYDLAGEAERQAAFEDAMVRKGGGRGSRGNSRGRSRSSFSSRHDALEGELFGYTNPGAGGQTRVYPTEVRKLEALRGDVQKAARQIMRFSKEYDYQGGLDDLEGLLFSELEQHGFMPTLLAEQVKRGHRVSTEFPPNAARRDMSRHDHARTIAERFGNLPPLTRSSATEVTPYEDPRKYLPPKKPSDEYTGGATNVIDPETGDVWLPDPYIPGQGQWLPMNTRTDTLVDPSASSLANESVSTKRGK